MKIGYEIPHMLTITRCQNLQEYVIEFGWCQKILKAENIFTLRIGIANRNGVVAQEDVSVSIAVGMEISKMWLKEL